jgi:hypothetical protein
MAKASKTRTLWEIAGVALCAEAQADGVPCVELGRECETCEMAVRHLHDLRKAREAELSKSSDHVDGA